MAWRVKRHTPTLAENLREGKRTSLARSCRREDCDQRTEAKRSNDCSARSIKRILKSEKLTEYMAPRRRTRLGVSNPFMMRELVASISTAFMARGLGRDWRKRYDDKERAI